VLFGCLSHSRVCDSSRSQGPRLTSPPPSMAYSAHHPIQLITPGSSTSRTPLLEKSLANSQRQRYPSLDLLATPPPEKPPQKITEEESWDALEKTLRLIPCEWKTCQCVLGSINLLATVCLLLRLPLRLSRFEF
jgi:hypothetical protein